MEPAITCSGRTKRLADGGALEQLRVVGVPCAELGLVQPPGVSYDIDRVPIADPDWDLGPGPTDNDIGIQEVGRQGFERGAAKFARLEGIWERAGLTYLSCTRGGATQLAGNPPFGEYGNGFGQVWVLDPKKNTLTLIFESPGSEVLDLPDNLTLSPRGNMILCEDGSTDKFVRCLTPNGEFFDFAKNMIAGAERQEFAGATFSPDGRTLFVNIQFGSGLTFAIWREHGGTFL